MRPSLYLRKPPSQARLEGAVAISATGGDDDVSTTDLRTSGTIRSDAFLTPTLITSVKMKSSMSGSSSSSEDTEARILRAAKHVFMRRGVAGSRMQEVADEAGVNRALLNYYFRSKKKLAEAVFVRVARSFGPSLMRALGSDQPLRQKLEEVVELQISLLIENPYLLGYMIAEFQYRPDELRPVVQTALPPKKIRGTVLAKLQSQLDDAAERGDLKPTSATEFVVTIMSQVNYPFAAGPLLDAILGIDADARDEMMRRRAETLPEQILAMFAA